MSSEIPGGGPYKAATGRHESLSADSIKRTRRLWSLYCSSGTSYCEKFKEITVESSRLIARARLEDLGTDYNGADLGVIRFFNRFSELYGSYLGGAMVAKGEKVLVLMKTDITTPDGLTLRNGDTVFIDVGTALGLISLGFAEPALTWSLNLDSWLKSLKKSTK